MLLCIASLITTKYINDDNDQLICKCYITQQLTPNSFGVSICQLCHAIRGLEKVNDQPFQLLETEIGTCFGHFLLPACTLNSQRPHFQFKIGEKNYYTFCLPTLTRMLGSGRCILSDSFHHIIQ